jgi:hypothetical protein
MTLYILKIAIPDPTMCCFVPVVKNEHRRSKSELRVFYFATTLQKEQKIMTNTAANTDSDDLLQYNPNRLLDTLIENLRLKNDAALSRALEVAPPVISKIRHHRLPVGASLLIRMHEVSDLSIRDLRYLMGDRRNKFRISDKQFKPKVSETQVG